MEGYREISGELSTAITSISAVEIALIKPASAPPKLVPTIVPGLTASEPDELTVREPRGSEYKAFDQRESPPSANLNLLDFSLENAVFHYKTLMVLSNPPTLVSNLIENSLKLRGHFSRWILPRRKLGIRCYLIL